MPPADEVRLLSDPFDAAASSNPVFSPNAVGFEHCRHVAFSGRLLSQIQDSDGVSVAFRHLRGIEATVSPYLANLVHPQPRALSGVCDYSGRARCFPRRALAYKSLIS
ncbi:hypothetical protein ACSYAD_32225 [Acaryochloris marina NIES-2412]|uniref:hypothetical protein n=1 Tax=Acaryochloris marina TaxID=155978 RepID=UPI004059FD24